MARPTKLTTQVRERILAALRAGSTRTAAAESAGIHRSQLARWMERFASFRDAVMQAEAEVEVGAATAIHQAFEAGDWRAALAWLERRRNQEWGRQDRLEVISSVREMAQRAGLPDEEVDAIVADAERDLRELRRVAAHR